MGIPSRMFAACKLVCTVNKLGQLSEGRVVLSLTNPRNSNVRLASPFSPPLQQSRLVFVFVFRDALSESGNSIVHSLFHLLDSLFDLSFIVFLTTRVRKGEKQKKKKGNGLSLSRRETHAHRTM